MSPRRPAGPRIGSHLAAFAAGVVVATALGAAARPGPDRFKRLDLLAQALAYIEGNYVDEIDGHSLVQGAVAGMVERLDRHSAFLPPGRYRQVRQDARGELGGVGLVVLDDPDAPAGAAEPVVTAVLPASPAEHAGLLAGDRVVEIDGAPTRGRAARTWRRVLRGAPGTAVELAIGRTGWPAARRFTLVRALVPAVDTASLPAGVGYLRLRQFQADTVDQARRGLVALQAAAGGRLTGLVLDLRGNPGGLLEQGIRVADLFLAEGRIVTLVGRGGVAEPHDARAAGTFAGFPMVVLIDGGSASASEIVAGALQERGRAAVVGSRSYGKASVQTFIDLDDGSGLKLTTARYHTPGGRSIHGHGIDPDVVAPAGPTTAELPAFGPPTDPKILVRMRDDGALFVAYQTVLERGLSKAARNQAANSP